MCFNSFNLLTFIAIFICIICTNQKSPVRVNRCLADLLCLQVATNPEPITDSIYIYIVIENISRGQTVEYWRI
jgi:hypothetical protein